VIRVQTQVGEERTRLIISGEISSTSVELIESCCDQALSDGKTVDVVLDVTTIDDSGRALLRRLAAKDVCLVAKGVYHSYLVDAIRRAVNGDFESEA